MIKIMNVDIPAVKSTKYPVLVGTNLFNTDLKWLPNDSSQIVIITDHKVKKYYANALVTTLRKKGYDIALLSFPAGEKYKNINTKNKLEEQLLKLRCDRNTTILAVGGGVVGDLSGFIAATYMRGVSYIQIPTTLLAMVDSSIGGKTGIDNDYGKNLIGAFWQPKAVIADMNCLQTLPKKQMINGLIEAIKIFLVQDAKSFQYLNKNIEAILNVDKKVLSNIVEKAIQNKISVVEKDEKESGLRMILNFGHTIGHALEHVSQYKILHGYAVAYGMLVEAKMAELMEILPRKNYSIVESILKNLGIFSKDLQKWDINKIIHATTLDKKTKSGNANYILLSGIGSVYQRNHQYAHKVSADIIKQAYSEILGATPHGR